LFAVPYINIAILILRVVYISYIKLNQLSVITFTVAASVNSSVAAV